MTTTMMEMKKVVNMVREQNLPVKVMIGGAVITRSFADEIGAEGYSKVHRKLLWKLPDF